eukprot:11840299-Alexandrium_andersonii.AAC.1
MFRGRWHHIAIRSSATLCCVRQGATEPNAHAARDGASLEVTVMPRPQLHTPAALPNRKSRVAKE